MYELVDPDVRLMLEVRNDNAAAFEELVNRYQSRVIGFLENSLPAKGMSEDLAQDVFMRVYRARKSYVPGAKFSTWLFTIANNVASNAMRSMRRRKEYTLSRPANADDETAGIERIAQAPSGLLPTRQLAQMEMSEKVREAISKLNERQRTCLLLSKFEGMSYEDIGMTMGMSAKAVKSLMSRAREKLREHLEPYFEGEKLGSGEGGEDE